MSRGRIPPPATIDHAANLRDRLGRAAIEVDNPGVQWDRMAEVEREHWRNIGEAVMRALVDKGDQRGEFATSSIYGYKNQKPYVNVEVSVSPMQVSPAKAREMALMLLESADASESDAVLIGFARDALGMDQQDSAKLLHQLRQYREKQRGSEVQSA